MENLVELISAFRSSTTRTGDHSLRLATLTEAAQLWKQTRSLTAYHLIVSALDSNDNEVRRLAEEFLNRSSPRPASHRAKSGGGTAGTSQRREESS